MLVIGVGKATTPTSFKNACDNFIAIENLEQNGNDEISAKDTFVEQDKELWRLMHHAWQYYRNEAGWAKLGEVGKYIKRLKPDFDPRNYGLKKISDFFEKHPTRYLTRTTKLSGLEFQLITKSSQNRD